MVPLHFSAIHRGGRIRPHPPILPPFQRYGPIQPVRATPTDSPSLPNPNVHKTTSSPSAKHRRRWSHHPVRPLTPTSTVTLPSRLTPHRRAQQRFLSPTPHQRVQQRQRPHLSNGMEWNGMEWNGMEWNGTPSPNPWAIQQGLRAEPAGCALAESTAAAAPSQQVVSGGQRVRPTGRTPSPNLLLT
jgi:hypothetical protein